MQHYEQNVDTSRRSEFIVVGGGIIGSAIAYYLARDGKDVLLLEGERIASGASGAAAGMLAPHLESFSTPALKNLAERSLELIRSLVDDLSISTPIDVALCSAGFVSPFKDLPKKSMNIGQQEYWNRSRLRSEIPAICDQAECAYYYPDQLQLLPGQLNRALIDAARAKGARYLEQQPVVSLDIQCGTVRGVETLTDSYSCNNVIIASGLGQGMGDVLSNLGINLPTVPVKGEIIAVSLPEIRLDYTIYTHDVYLVPKPGGEIWIGATSIPFNHDKRVSIKGMLRLLHEGSMWIPQLEHAAYTRSWAGLRPQTIDGLPYIGQYKGVTGLYIAAGHYRNGILLSAVTGEIISRLVAGESEEELGITEFSPMRILEKGRLVH
ncbi:MULTISPECIES: FAD-dependent oxidoreductase [unclassified Paenibacillus]|uniref:NAD(P)/FAD-dependent oxidoreductase n=1 Tax=Paenibacillus provencensis TaxID=441151 RepID=A0ABW3PM81_9BACL|nr:MULTISPECIES: FAD-dependent oxidoreductase [unclassified Paenibacillus]MCM3126701.1 FAD-dependent oxidoreductase [Paenibacillus sp. MER 78]SFS58151.1 glycine oxidase [Paenibacillus sp. 453mf]